MGANAAIRAALLDKFRNGTRDRVDRIGRLVLDVGSTAWNDDSKRSAMHELHTLKGEARMMRFPEVCALSHLAEELLLATPSNALRGLLLRILDLVIGSVNGEAVSSEILQAITVEGRALAGEKAVVEPPSVTTTLAAHRAAPTVRIDLSRLDELSDLSANLMVNQATIEYAVDDLIAVLRSVDDDGVASEIMTTLAGIRENIRDNGLRLQGLEAHVRDMRLLPLATLLDPYPRAIHDLAREQGKDVRVEIAGNDVEIDKHVFEALGEPLLHLVRNAIDHGIEAPEERVQRGKEPTATIVLSAQQRGGWVELEVRDDGRGIAPQDLRETLVQRGLLSSQEVATRSDAQILGYLFRSGFTTRTTVTDVSGRGMGLDIVKQRIEALGGSVRVDSEPGAGTSFSMRVPISAVLVRAMVVEAAGAVCAIPTDSIASLARLDAERLVDGERLPLFDLAHLLSGADPRSPRLDCDSVVVLQIQGTRVGLLVDGFRGEQKLVHRSMDPFCEGLRLFAGSATLDSGQLVLLLNVHELMAVSDPQYRGVSARVERQRSVLVVEDSDVARDLVVRTLRDAGFVVEQAEHGRQALERMRDWRPDVIVSDIDMPEVDGWKLLREVRRERNLRDVPVVVFTSRGAAQDRERAKALGADAYLVKTHTLETMLVATVVRMASEGGRL